MSGIVSSGRVSFPKEAPWRDTFLRELSESPLEEFFDRVDAFVHALSWLAAGGVSTPEIGSHGDLRSARRAAVLRKDWKWERDTLEPPW